MYRHLVAVKVGVERRADERVQPYGSAVNEHRLKRLYRQTVQRRRTVEQHGVLLDNVFKRVPHLVVVYLCAVDLLLRILYVCRLAHFDKSLDHEGLEQLKSHFLRQTALVYLKRRTDNDDRTSGIVNTLAEQVLTETSLLTAKHLGKRLERTVGRAGDRLAAASVVYQGVNGFLEHTLFVSDNDLGGVYLDELSQTVVTADNAAVELVKVGAGKASAVKLYHRSDVGGKHRDDVKYHPFQLIAGLAERLDDLKALYYARLFLTRCILELLLERFGKIVYVYRGEQLLYRLGAHADAELVLVHLAVFLILLFAQHHSLFKRSRAGIENDVLGEIEHLLKLLGRNVKHESHTRGGCLEVPDVRHGSRKLDMSHSFAADLFGGHFNAALVADYSLSQVVGILILTARARAVLGRPEYALAEKTAHLRLESTVVDRLWLSYLAVRPCPNHFRGCKTYFD